MTHEVPRRRLSLITDLIIFLILTSLLLVILKAFNVPYELASEDEQVTPLISDTTENVIDENSMYITKINNEYGIKVQYGEDVESFTNKVNATSQENIYILNNNLKNIYEALKKYPEDLFKIFKSGDYPMYIIIVDSFQNDNIALASRNKLNEFRMYISNNSKFERAFHHEMFHIIEYYMTLHNSNTFVDWDNLNPIDFNYNSDTSKLNKKYVYDDTNYDKDNTYFVTRYSKATEKEDRAEIFAELMTMSKKAIYLNDGDKLKLKADEIINTLTMNITSEDFYCTRFFK